MTPPVTTKWTDEKYNDLVQLLHTGLSYGECADALSGKYPEMTFTKNSCLGVYHRRTKNVKR